MVQRFVVRVSCHTGSDVLVNDSGNDIVNDNCPDDVLFGREGSAALNTIDDSGSLNRNSSTASFKACASSAGQ